jgi:glycosyltransferase involved in cell wall biosynthesis
MIHLCIDARMINNSGIGVYIQNYIGYVLENRSVEVTLLGNHTYLSSLYGRYENCNIKSFSAEIYSIKEQLLYPNLVPVCDVFWSPHYNVPILPIRASRRAVTVPDCAHLALSKTFNFGLLKRIYSKIVFRAAVYLSDTVMTISNFSKSEIVKYTKVNPVRIKVILLGIDQARYKLSLNKVDLNNVRLKYNLKSKYILFVGNVKPHKNLKALIIAFDLIQEDIPSYKLLIVGKKEGFISGDNQVVELIKQRGLESRIDFTGYVDDKDLPFLYESADLFVFPSIYEGFGFPPLEAMASGCPVITTKLASMPEICGDAVRYTDISEPKNLATDIMQLLGDKPLRRFYVEKGNERVKKFTWKKSGLKFVNILEL